MEDQKLIQRYWERDESAIPATAAKYGSDLLFNGTQRQISIPPKTDTEQNFVKLSSLLGHNNDILNEGVEKATVPIDQYNGIYEKVDSAGSEILAQSVGSAVGETEVFSC